LSGLSGNIGCEFEQRCTDRVKTVATNTAHVTTTRNLDDNNSRADKALRS